MQAQSKTIHPKRVIECLMLYAVQGLISLAITVHKAPLNGWIQYNVLALILAKTVHKVSLNGLMLNAVQGLMSLAKTVHWTVF